MRAKPSLVSPGQAVTVRVRRVVVIMDADEYERIEPAFDAVGTQTRCHHALHLIIVDKGAIFRSDGDAT
jgi:hypothetical protein